MSLTCSYSFPNSGQRTKPQVKEVRVQVPLRHQPFARGAMPQVPRLTCWRRTLTRPRTAWPTRPKISASFQIVVDAPPGMISPAGGGMCHRVPQPYGAVAVGGAQQLAVRAERHPVHTALGVSREESADSLSGGQIPQPHGAVAVGGGHRRLPDRLVLPAAVRRLRKARTVNGRESRSSGPWVAAARRPGPLERPRPPREVLEEDLGSGAGAPIFGPPVPGRRRCR